MTQTTIETIPFNPVIYSFTYDDYQYPIEEWVKWHKMLGYDIYLLFVGEDIENMKKIEEKYKIHVWYIEKKRELRFIDHRAYYKYLAQLTAPQGLKLMLDIDEFLPYRIPTYIKIPEGYAGSIIQHIVYKGDVYEADETREMDYIKNVLNKAKEKGITDIPVPWRSTPMLRINENYVQVLGDGANVNLKPLQNLPIIHVLHFTFKNCYEITRKSWLWVIKGDNYCANIEYLPIKKSNFPYDPRLRDILKDLPRNN
jgi:hypothetical protein